MTDREAYIILNGVSGVGPIRLSKLVEAFGSPLEVLRAKKKDLSTIDGIGEELAERIFKWSEEIDIEKELKLADKAGVEIVTRADKDYPKRLIELPDAPLCLYVRGDKSVLEGNLIGIVGSRRISNYGKRICEKLSTEAAYAGWTIVSGLAFGIDAIAHNSVVEAGGRTIAVLGGGLGRVFPQEHIPLARRISEKSGAVISEFPMEFPPNKRSFPMRNRIISGLSLGVIVVEAGDVSGALITAKFALEQGRIVFAVPGEVDNPQARGCNRLIKEGAILVEGFSDVLAEFEFLPGILSNENSNKREYDTEKTEKNLKLDEDEAKILAILEKGELSAESISIESGIEPEKLLPLLMMMEMKKLVVQYPGKIYSIRR